MISSFEVKNLVIGAGASGLSIAARLGKEDTLVLSKNVGGLLRSHQAGGFLFDYGGHVYTAADADVVSFMKDVHATHFSERKAFYLLDGDIRGRRASFPVQSSGAFEISPMPISKPYENLAAFALAQFGSSFYEEFYAPFNKRVWGFPPSQMSADWVASRVQTSSDTKKAWGSNASFLYAPGERIIDKLVKDYGGTIMAGEAAKIDGDTKTCYATCEADGVTRTIPIKYSNVFSTAPVLRGDVLTTGMLAVGIGLNKKVDHDFHWVYPHVDSVVHRVTLLSRYHPDNAPLQCDSLLLEIPISKYTTEGLKRILNRQSAGVDIGIALLNDAGFYDISESDIVTKWQKFCPASMPVQTVGLRDQIAKVKSSASGHGIFMAGRWGAHGYWNLEHIFKDADSVVDFATRPRTKGVANAYLRSSFYYAV